MTRSILALMIPALMVSVTVAENSAGPGPVSPSAPLSASRSNQDSARHTTAVALDPEAQQDEIDAQIGALDLYGNAVTDAVATYKLDAEGSLYELHSPQTELPRLGSPKS